NLPNLTYFSAIVFFNEFRQMGMGDDVDISKTCNMSEWRRRLYAGTTDRKSELDDDDYVDIATLQPKPTSQAGIIYALTTTSYPKENVDQDQVRNQGQSQIFVSFLFAHHKTYITKTVPSPTTNSSGSSDRGISSEETQT